MGSLRTYKLALLRVNLDIFVADLSLDLCMFMVNVDLTLILFFTANA